MKLFKYLIRIYRKKREISSGKKKVTRKISFTVTCDGNCTRIASSCYSVAEECNVDVIKIDFSKYPSIDRSYITVKGKRGDVEKFIKEFLSYSVRSITSVRC